MSSPWCLPSYVPAWNGSRASRQASEHLLPNGTQQQRLRLTRAFGHREMKETCAWIAGRQGRVNQHLKPMVDGLKKTVIVDVASSFCDLQEARHRADYDHLAPFSKPAVLAHLGDADKAIQTLASASERDRELFFSLLALRARQVP